MKYAILTVKLMPDVMADLDAFALAHFPVECPKCGSTGQLRSGGTCPSCDGRGMRGNRSDAVRYLLQYALGDQASPEARAMAAIYANVAPKFIGEMTHLTHRMESEMRDMFVENIEAMMGGK